MSFVDKLKGWTNVGLNKTYLFRIVTLVVFSFYAVPGGTEYFKEMAFKTTLALCLVLNAVCIYQDKVLLDTANVPNTIDNQKLE
eukprot:snap_masked-scaffold_5-processed-gene-20.81-mRNA-1 protein AED:1.00 eAED:1.00 QI:0/0/0/0/1/1/2/0/83